MFLLLGLMSAIEVWLSNFTSSLMALLTGFTRVSSGRYETTASKSDCLPSGTGLATV